MPSVATETLPCTGLRATVYDSAALSISAAPNVPLTTPLEPCPVWTGCSVGDWLKNVAASPEKKLLVCAAALGVVVVTDLLVDTDAVGSAVDRTRVRDAAAATVHDFDVSIGLT